MSADMPEVEAYVSALLREVEKGLDFGEPVDITNRRIAAIAHLHELLDPWGPCLCNYCAFHVKHLRDS